MRSNLEVFSGTLPEGATIMEWFFIILVVPPMMRVYEDQGNVIGCRYKIHHGRNGRVYDMDSLGRHFYDKVVLYSSLHFYDKVVLSGSPSAGPAIASAIHLDDK
uniref:Uncharacterized protein n=1 Tax=Aegilops tauschii TaxID=37682 RepID=N1R4C7_AEGTA